MFLDLDNVKVYIRPGVTDCRKAINGLSIMVENEMKLNPFDKSLFLFCNKRKNLLKILYWDKTGFALWHKKLEKNKYPWVNKDDAKYELTRKQLQWLLEGINFFAAHDEIIYEKTL